MQSHTRCTLANALSGGPLARGRLSTSLSSGSGAQNFRNGTLQLLYTSRSTFDSKVFFRRVTTSSSDAMRSPPFSHYIAQTTDMRESWLGTAVRHGQRTLCAHNHSRKSLMSATFCPKIAPVPSHVAITCNPMAK